VEARGDIDVPYGWALLKLYAGSMKKPFDRVAGQETVPRGDIGDEAVEPALEACSYSAKRHPSEQ